MTCHLRGWADDDTCEDGVFDYDGKVMVELRVLHQLRTACHTGTLISTSVGDFPRRRLHDLDWLEQIPIAGARLVLVLPGEFRYPARIVA